MLIEQGTPMEAVSRTVGHANVTITQRIYDKAFRRRNRLAADATDARFGVGLLSAARKKPAVEVVSKVVSPSKRKRPAETRGKRKPQ